METSQQAVKELFDDIDELLREDMAPSTKAHKVETLDDLDDLLQESLELKAEANAGKGYREKLKKGKLPAEEKAYIEAKLLEWEAKREWVTLSVRALFARQRCACGQTHTLFKGLYYHQKHRTDKHAQRWVGAAEVGEHAAGLPQRTMVEDTVTAICTSCSLLAGFDLFQAEAAWTE
jgi:hypothetical protein